MKNTIKKQLKIIIPILLLGSLGFMGYKVTNQINYKKEVAENIKIIPVFSYENIKGGIFTNKDLKRIPTVFIYFNSECEYCNEETQMIKENIVKFKPFQIIFISFEKLNKISDFANKYQLNSNDNVTFLSDSKVTFATTFDVKSLPCIVLYDENQKLIEKIKGQTKAETLIKKLNRE